MALHFLTSLIESVNPKHSRSAWKKSYKTEINSLVSEYLYGLNGIEIGASGKSFGLENQKGSYANIDIIDAATRAEFKKMKQSQLVNILAAGDDLPFKNDVFDYVFTSHVIEHFFDPLKAIKEWFRVLKSGGYIFMIIPHKDRTFDRNRELTTFSELLSRHNNEICYSDYAHRTEEGKQKHESKNDKDHHILIKETEPSVGWERFDSYDFLHHWSVYNTQSFIDICKKMNWEIIYTRDLKDKFANEFIVILKKT